MKRVVLWFLIMFITNMETKCLVNRLIALLIIGYIKTVRLLLTFMNTRMTSMKIY